MFFYPKRVEFVAYIREVSNIHKRIKKTNTGSGRVSETLSHCLDLVMVSRTDSEVFKCNKGKEVFLLCVFHTQYGVWNTGSTQYIFGD